MRELTREKGASTKLRSGILPWIGGKSRLAPRLIERIDTVPHRLYAEPFVGMGGVFLRRRPARVEAINDLNRDVVNLFRIVQYHPAALFDALRLQLASRAEFERLHLVDSATLTDVQRAARFFAIQRLCYGGKPFDRSFPVNNSRRPVAFRPDSLRSLIELVHERLAGVTVECLDFQEFLGRYDRSDALFYVDPPYYGTEGVYGKGLYRRADCQRLARLLTGLKGRWILSMIDRPETRAVFDGFRVEEVETQHCLGRRRAAELIISGG